MLESPHTHSITHGARKLNLRLPGPIPVPEDILETMSRPMINHRGPQFAEMLYRVTDRLKRVFRTDGDVFVLTSSGTGAMEAAIVNTLSPGDRVLCASMGYFGDRFGEIASRYGADVRMLSFDPGAAVDPDAVRSALEGDPDVKAVLVTHNETSTGVANDMEAIGGVVKGEFDRLLLVDGISSVCSLPLETDAWGCDVVATASQKGWMLPPGLAFLSFSEAAWEAHAPGDHAAVLLRRRAVPALLRDGSAAVHARAVGDVRAGRGPGEHHGGGRRRPVEAPRLHRPDDARRDKVPRDCRSSPTKSVASDTVTAVAVPDDVDCDRLLAIVREEYGVVLAAGQGAQKGKVFRIGHMGRVTPEEIQETLDALKAALPRATG